jgi:hypothetical protein
MENAIRNSKGPLKIATQSGTNAESIAGMANIAVAR